MKSIKTKLLDGTVEYRLNGKLHRVDGPAVEYPDGRKRWYQDDKLHRLDGPAIEYPYGTKEWWLGTKEWWLDGKQLSEKEFRKISYDTVQKPLDERVNSLPTRQYVEYIFGQKIGS